MALRTVLSFLPNEKVKFDAAFESLSKVECIDINDLTDALYSIRLKEYCFNLLLLLKDNINFNLMEISRVLEYFEFNSRIKILELLFHSNNAQKEKESDLLEALCRILNCSYRNNEPDLNSFRLNALNYILSVRDFSITKKDLSKLLNINKESSEYTQIILSTFEKRLKEESPVLVHPPSPTPTLPQPFISCGFLQQTQTMIYFVESPIKTDNMITKEDLNENDKKKSKNREINNLKLDNPCTICEEIESNAILFPCMHSTICRSCAVKVKKDGVCPFCRTQIDNVFKRF